MNMYRHSPVRNQRSKGIKIKHVLQICLLVAVCFWLIFQIKRSHDKKKEFEAGDAKISLSTHTQSSEVVKFGRKDIQPKLEESTREAEKHEAEEEQEQEEQEEIKHDEEEQDDDKIEEEKDDGGGGGDDEIDANEQEKLDMEVDREEVDAIDEEKETEETDEKESEEKDGESQTEHGVSLDEQDQDGASRNTREAREEHYKADDASSAVTHDAPTVVTENVNGTLDNPRENVDNGETAKNEASSNTTVIQDTGSETSIDSLENGPPLNTTVIQETGSETSIDSLENGPPLNTTVITSGSTQAQNTTGEAMVSGEQSGNSTIASPDDNQPVSNSENLLEVSKSEENSSGPAKTEAKWDAGEGEGENAETRNVTDGTDEVEHDSSDASHIEEKEVRTDLETLPEIETEGGNSEDTAAE